MSQASEDETNDANSEETALIWKERGNCHYNKREYEDASKAYKKGLEALKNLDFRGPLAIALNANLVMIHLKLKEFEEAAQLCNLILAKEPQNTKALYRRALAKEGFCLDNNRSLSKEAIQRNLKGSMDDLKECLSTLCGDSPSVDQKQKEACYTALVRLQGTYESYSSSDGTLVQIEDINCKSRLDRTAAEQKQDILRLFMARKGPKARLAGEAFYLVSWNWWREWCRYVNFFYLVENEKEDEDKAKHILQLLPSGATFPRADEDNGSSDDDSSCDSSFHPKPDAIDNAVLFMLDSPFHRHWFHTPIEQPLLKPNLVRGYHYEILPREVYFALRAWYGELTPSICRRTTEGGIVKLYPSPQDRPPSKTLPGCAACRAPYAVFKCKSCMSVCYCDRECQQSHWPFHRLSCTSSHGGESRRSEGGMIGLNNLGNTCFMNSALQCLSHATPLTRQFLSNQFKKDINTSNPLGTGGKLAVAYEVVMKELWMKDKASAISPTSLKRAIALFAPRFAGCLQHDAQEFLAYLLDGLHEDLNRIKKAPYVEMPDVTDAHNMAVAGARAWDAHRKRNDSLVFDSFYGQFQSTCICPKCRKVSVSFDAFNHVSLEIPQGNKGTVIVPILFFAARGGRKPLRYAVTVPRGGSLADLKTSLAELTGISRSNLAFADIYNHNIYELLQDNKAVHNIGANDIIAAYEVEPFTSRSIHAVAVNALTDIGHDKDQNKMLIGFPLLTSFHVDLSCQQIWESLWSSLRHYITRGDIGDNGVLKPEDILSVHIVDGKSKAKLDVFSLEDGKLTSLLPTQSSDSLLKYLGDKCTEDFLFLSLEWDGRVVQNGAAVVKPEGFMAYTEDESVQEALRSQRNNHGRSAVSLDQCFKTFTKPERLDERNMWYCSNCEEHVKALKTMKLWRLPNILIVHLKRFAFKHTLRREKLDTLVDFPVDCLNMEPHRADRNLGSMTPSFIDENVPAEYDLFGVVNHYGRLGFGHYTAFARQWDEDLMSDIFTAFDDSIVTKAGVRTQEIVSSAAYVLFYRRRSFN